jgi:hypothetical protein
MVVLFFGGLGAYYFKVFQWRHLEDPTYDLLVVKKDDSAELAFFRKKTNPDVIDPARQQMDKLIDLRKASKKGTVVPEDFDQDMKEIGKRLVDIMNAGKLRQIPRQYEKQYREVLLAIGDVYRAWRDLEAAVYEEIPEEKAKLISSSIKSTQKADRRFKVQRQFFYTK